MRSPRRKLGRRLRAYQNRALERSCALYNRCQPLFVGAPKLFDHIRKRQTNGQPDLELIDSGAVLAINDSEIYVVGPGYGKLAQQLDAQIPVWARKEFPQAPLFLRLDPSRHFKTQPLQALFEASIVPADPRWMKTLALFPEMTAYAQYELLGDLEQEVSVGDLQNPSAPHRGGSVRVASRRLCLSLEKQRSTRFLRA